MKVLIVDDEPLARKRLLRLMSQLQEYEFDIQEAEDGVVGLAALRATRFDVVLLDIRMPGLDGLTLASEEADLPPIIFTTAYDEYAVRAFEARALDYLLKPVSEVRLREAFSRVATRTEDPTSRDPALAVALREALRTAQRAEPLRLVAQEGSSSHFFDAHQVCRLYASEKYTVLVHEEQEYLIEESLSQLEQRLAGAGFFRTHRAELINLRRVKALHVLEEGSVVELEDGQRARVSRRHLSSLRARLAEG